MPKCVVQTRQCGRSQRNPCGRLESLPGSSLTRSYRFFYPLHLLKFHMFCLLCVCVCMLSCSTLVTPWTVARQAPLSRGLSQQYWSGLQFCLLGDLPNVGIEPVSPPSPALAGGFFTTESPEKPLLHVFRLF